MAGRVPTEPATGLAAGQGADSSATWAESRIRSASSRSLLVTTRTTLPTNRLTTHHSPFRVAPGT